MYKALFFIAVLFALNSSCSKKAEILAPDNLIFGEAYGFCVGKCFRVFKLDAAGVQEDMIIEHLTNYLNYQFNTGNTLPDDKFQAVKNLLNEIPEELLTGDSKTYGCPDCADQGGVYVEINRAGKNSRFLLDMFNSGDQSDELIAFKVKLRNAIDQLDN